MYTFIQICKHIGVPRATKYNHPSKPYYYDLVMVKLRYNKILILN